MNGCNHLNTASISIPGLSDMRRCVDCESLLSGRESAAARARLRVRVAPPVDFLTEVELGAHPFQAPLERGWLGTTLRRIRLEKPMREFVSRATDSQLEEINALIQQMSNGG